MAVGSAVRLMQSEIVSFCSAVLLPRLAGLEFLVLLLGRRRGFLFNVFSVLERVLAVFIAVNVDDLACSGRNR